MKKYFDKTNHSHCWSDYPGVGKITDEQVAEFVMKHTTIFDRLFRPRKLVEAGLVAWHMMAGVYETPKGKWRF